MEILLALLQFFAEVFVAVLTQFLGEMIIYPLTRKAYLSHDPVSRFSKVFDFLAMTISMAALGFIAGSISIPIAPKHVVSAKVWRLVIVVFIPILAGAITGTAWTQLRKKRWRLQPYRFLHGFIFGAVFLSVRYFYAQ